MNFKNENTRIGELLHKEQKSKELIFEKIKIDDIKNNVLIEYKKSSSNLDGTIMQVIYYLDYFHKKGLNYTGLVKDLTYGDRYKIEYNEENKRKLEECIKNIQSLVKLTKIPSKKRTKKECKGCSFKDYCWS